MISLPYYQVLKKYLADHLPAIKKIRLYTGQSEASYPVSKDLPEMFVEFGPIHFQNQLPYRLGHNTTLTLHLLQQLYDEEKQTPPSGSLPGQVCTTLSSFRFMAIAKKGATETQIDYGGELVLTTITPEVFHKDFMVSLLHFKTAFLIGDDKIGFKKDATTLKKVGHEINASATSGEML